MRCRQVKRPSVLRAGGCVPKGFQAPNHFAVVGFLLPFAAAGLTAALILACKGAASSRTFLALYLTVVPLILLVGLGSSISSIPRIEKLDDKDYAYAGLTLNVFFLSAYGISLILLFASPH